MEGAPKYQRLISWIKEKIDRGELAPGDKLNTEHEMSAMFQVSRQTVRHALSVLEQEGIVECRQGSGNYISGQEVPRREERGSGTVVIVSTYLNAYIFPNIIEGMENVLEQNGYGVQISFTHNKTEKERSVLKRILQSRDAVGLIIEPTKSGLPNPNLDLYHKILEQKIPMLFFNSYYPEIPAPHVCLDDEKAGYTAATYLMNMGHERIGGIFKLDDGQGRRRYKGFQAALMQRGIPLKEENIIWIDTDDERTMTKDDQKILRRLRGCTGCVAYNDEVAYNLEVICARHGITIPNDLSIASIDNSEMARLCEVPLTSVIHPMEKLGEKAAQNLISLIKEPDFEATYEFPANLEIRNSVCAAGEEEEAFEAQEGVN